MKFRLAVACGFLSLFEAAGQSPAHLQLVPALGWDAKNQGCFPVSIAADQENNIWVGTEGEGLWKYGAATKKWTQYTTKDGLGDDCVYGVAVDNQDRVWAGHLNHGVSVFNGKTWRNYGLLDGPLGDRVFAIAVSPKDGDVWVATDMGLSRYSQKRNDWDYYTRASGLVSDQVQGLAFDGKGTLYAATQCNGIAIASAENDYNKWSSVSAPAEMPDPPIGQGLLTDLTNGVSAVAPPGMGPAQMSLIAVPTPFGAEGRVDSSIHEAQPGRVSDMDLSSWGYVRISGGAAQAVFQGAIPEDWITTVQQAGKDIWVGLRKSGVVSLDTASPQNKPLPAVVENGSVFIRAIYAQQNGPHLFAAYGSPGGGLMTLPGDPPPAPIENNAHEAAPAKLPEPCAAPRVEEAKAFSARLDKVTRKMAPGEAVYLADDWRTEGDWIERYGNWFAVLCGMSEGGDHVYALEAGYEVNLRLGPDSKPGHDHPVRSQGKDLGSDPRCLYDPSLGQRRDAAIDDGSGDAKVYPDDSGGPGLWVTVKVPEGVHCLSLYFANYDAHAGGTKIYRDYDVQLAPWSAKDSDVEAAAPLARTRVTDFWGGVYKQFIISGPAGFVVKIGRNRSSGTRLQGVFLDRVDGKPPENPGFLPGFDKAPYLPPDEPEDYQPTPLTEAAVNLWSRLDDELSMRGSFPLQMPFRTWCYRAAIAGQAPPELLERWRWQISIWTPEDRQKFDEAMKNARQAAP